MNEKIQNILTEIESVIVGKNENVEKILMAILAQGHVLMEDVPGVGKTTTALTFAKVLGLDTRRVQFTSDTVPSDVIGYSVYDKSVGFLRLQARRDHDQSPAGRRDQPYLEQDAVLPFWKRWKSTASPSTVKPTTYRRPSSSSPRRTPPAPPAQRCSPVPSSTVSSSASAWAIPTTAARSTFSATATAKIPLDRVQPVVTKDELLELIQEARTVEANDRIFDYVTTLAEATRTHPMVELGVSPRGALALCRMAKAHAFLAGRDFVVPEDVAAVFPDVCAHRLILSAKARMMEEKAENILAEILKSVDMPVLKA